ncbi:myosin heavy chain, striated muscle-like isoform X3 [Selaginella moellendorffii]|uniref:myosin heavy chain, striated muscle-like isoform X3 n=1 Tax=Selaginella moellendorffii TaxID=88036 RepID=UPI000D1C3AB6|nr:myosin heavy chain, striated muscle-like isoform X3 [Selaginella moellendorffii]|eukprot:XP_024537891.1 myosin heavy chain, striated muscle-like isoform X3 [Selaginella moellendorffii]
MPEQILQEPLPAGVNDRTWGVLSALSDAAKKRAQGQHMFLTLPEHTLGRMVADSLFLFDSPSISGRHCRIFRKNITTDDGISGAAYIKDSSSNGTYVNGQRLRKDSPELRLQHGDVISLAALPELALAENGFAYVFRDTSSGLKRKPVELSKNEDGKRMKMSGSGIGDGPVNLADVRRLERSNQELRQKLELECNKSDSLNADLRAAKSSTESIVREAVDQCKSVYTQKLADLQAELSTKVSSMEEFSAKCVQQESVIEDLNNRLKGAAQSRMEAEEALKNSFKANREELEKQLEDERSQRRKERQEIEAQHKSAVDRIRTEAEQDSNRQAEAFSRQRGQLEDKMAALQDSVTEYRVQIESQRKQLGMQEEERETRMNFEKKGQELQIQLNTEQHASAALRQELEKTIRDLEMSLNNLEECKHEKDAAHIKIASLQLEKEEVLNKLKLESQRFEGARDRILLRETQLRAFQSTAEEISALQQKQQFQLQAMMQTLKDDDAEYANAAPAGYCYNNGEEHSESKTVDEEMKDGETMRDEGSNGTHVNATQEKTLLATLDLNEMAEETSGYRVEHNNQTQAREDIPTQLNVTQWDATQLIPLDMDQARQHATVRDDAPIMETQITAAEVPGTPLERDPETAGNEPGTPLLERNETENAGQVPGTPLLARGLRGTDSQTQLRRSSLCTADLVTSEVLGSDGNYSQDEVERRVLASQVGNSDSLQVRGAARDDAAVVRIDTLGSQSSAMVVKDEIPSPINEIAPDSQEEAGDTEEEAGGEGNSSDTDEN